MKTLLLLRHGKAEAFASGGDAERDLTERGEADVRTIAANLASLGGRPDLIVTSGARRARRTAEVAAAALGYDGDLIMAPSVYEAAAGTLLLVIQMLPAQARRVLMVGHNPGFEEVTDLLSSPGDTPAYLPTAALAHLEFDLQEWRDVAAGAGRRIGIYTARNIS